MKRLLAIVVLSICAFACRGSGKGKDILAPTGLPGVIWDRAWTLETPPTQSESPEVVAWRQRYEAWRNGTLTDYPFEPSGTIPPIAKGDGVSEAVVQLPARSVHETEPWGDEGCVWPVRNRWSPEWEQRYRQWITENATRTFSEDNQIPVDCSDLPYVFRWIFARINYLPQGVHDYSGAATFGNWNTRFSYLPTDPDWRRDQRFREAMKYALEQYARGVSIPFDTYPIDLQPQAGALAPGTVAADKHHVRIILRIDPLDADPIRQLSSTRPRKIRLLDDETLSRTIDNEGPGWGLVNFSWWDYDFTLHRYRCVPDNRMAGYSLMQYTLANDAQIPSELLQSWYRQGEIDPQQALMNQIGDLQVALNQRVDLVREGWAFYSTQPGNRDRTSIQYDDYSTPTRDGRLLEKVQTLRSMTQRYNFPTTWLDRQLEQIIIPVEGNVVTNARDVAYRLLQRALSVEPWDPPAMRWGMNTPVQDQVF